MTDAINQRAYWNAEVGQIWAAEAQRLDAMLAPLGALAMEALGAIRGMRVLDIGCGAGATTRALALQGADVVGVDVSEPLLEAARAAGGGPRYLQADAGHDALPGPFDAAFSRFGVMFFEDTPAAFRHIRKAIRPDAPLAFVCWGPISENTWATAPLAAALPHLNTPPAQTAPGAPGPFAFAQPGLAVEHLTQAGWRHAAARAWRGPYVVGDTPEEALAIMLKVGPLGRVLREQPHARVAVCDALLDMLKSQSPRGPIQFDASVWIVTARA